MTVSNLQAYHVNKVLSNTSHSTKLWALSSFHRQGKWSWEGQKCTQGCMARLWQSQSLHLGLLDVNGVLSSLHDQSYCWLHVAGVDNYVYDSKKNSWWFCFFSPALLGSFRRWDSWERLMLNVLAFSMLNCSVFYEGAHRRVSGSFHK